MVVDNKVSQQMAGRQLADIGVYGLGVIGTSLARNFARNGFTVALYNYETDVTEAFMESYGSEGTFLPTATEAEFAAQLSVPRVATVAVTAGPVTQLVADQLAAVFEEGDVIVDMGNSFFEDTIRREKQLAAKGLNFIGCGTSGGQEGVLWGPSLMVGGSKEGFDALAPMFNAIAAKAEDGHPCCVHAGSDGAGHFVKMVHNGIEYADMQLISEAYQVLRDVAGMDAAQIAQVFSQWNEGELESFLMEISADILAHVDKETGRPFVDIIDDVAGQKGTGLWTVQQSLLLGNPATAITEATFARLLSAQVDKRKRAIEVFDSGIDAPHMTDEERSQFVEDVRCALYASKIIAYSQGLDSIMAGAKEHGWDTDYAEVAKAWRKGCIIRARFLDRIAEAFDANPDCNVLMAEPFFAKELKRCEGAWRRVVQAATAARVPLMAFSTSLGYYDAMRSPRLVTALVQGQRDYFGAHTYLRNDREGVFHTLWAEEGQPEVRVK